MTIIAVLLVGIMLQLTILILVIVRASERVKDLSFEVRNLRLKSRTRVRRAGMQSGATTDEQILGRLGRASVGRRVVVGGDDDSALSQQLKRGSGEPRE